jgi:hypothetical protein
MLCQSKLIKGPGSIFVHGDPPCLLGLSATRQQYFSLRTNQSAVLFSQNKPAPAISHQPNKQAIKSGINQKLGSFTT